MGSDEENLDDLLKSLMEIEEVSKQSEFDADTEAGSELEPADMDFAIEDSENEETDSDTKAYVSGQDTEGFAIEDFDVLEPEPGELEETVSEEDSSGNDQANYLDDMINDDIIQDNAEVFAIEDFEVAEPGDEFNTAAGEADDMLSLLESMSEDSREPVDEADGAGIVHINENPAVNTKAEKKRSGVFSKIFPGKKKDQRESLAEYIETENQEGFLDTEGLHQENRDMIDEFQMDENLQNLLGEMENQDNNVHAEMEAIEPVKNKNIFLRILAFLTEADDEGLDEKLRAVHGMEPSDENKNILEELDKEDKNKKKKKAGGRKGKLDEIQNDEDWDDENAEERNKKKKKLSKNKKEKQQKDEKLFIKDNPGKKISKKNIAIISGLCLTIAAVIIVLCSIVPGFFDKRKARESYYQSDYETSFELLYGKKLDNSDTIIFNKSRIVLELNRKLNSYHNYLAINKEVQALDALMSGVEKYSDILPEAEEYHVTQEINAVYETMLSILIDKYDMSEPVAKVINSYDDLTYTRKLESIVHGTPFVLPQEELPESADVLPEEELPVVIDALPEEQLFLEPDETVSEEAAFPAEGSDNTGSELQEEISQELDIPLENNTASADSDAEPVPPAEDAENNSIPDSQGELIQGIMPPVNVEIHGN